MQSSALALGEYKMSNDLGNVTNRSIRDSIGNVSLSKAGLAVDGVNVQNVETTAAVNHIISGVFQTPFPVTAEINLSALAVINGKDGTEVSAAAAASLTKSYPAIAPAGVNRIEAQTIVYILACKGATAYIIESDVDVAAAQDDANYDLSCPAGFAPFGLIKIVQTPTATVGVAAFKLGSGTIGDLTGITGRVTTFFDISVCPPTIADIVTV